MNVTSVLLSACSACVHPCKQEIATVMRQRLNPIFIILNNGTYAVEEVRQLLHP